MFTRKLEEQYINIFSPPCMTNRCISSFQWAQKREPEAAYDHCYWGMERWFCQLFRGELMTFASLAWEPKAVSCLIRVLWPQSEGFRDWEYPTYRGGDDDDKVQLLFLIFSILSTITGGERLNCVFYFYAATFLRSAVRTARCFQSRQSSSDVCSLSSQVQDRGSLRHPSSHRVRPFSFLKMITLIKL